MSYTISYTYALLPDNMEDCIGQIIQLHHNADDNSRKVYNTHKNIMDKYVFILSEKKDWHKRDDDRIQLFPIEEYEKEGARIHVIGSMIGYEEIKKKFVSVGHINNTIN